MFANIENSIWVTFNFRSKKMQGEERNSICIKSLVQLFRLQRMKEIKPNTINTLYIFEHRLMQLSRLYPITPVAVHSNEMTRVPIWTTGKKQEHNTKSDLIIISKMLCSPSRSPVITSCTITRLCAMVTYWVAAIWWECIRTNLLMSHSGMITALLT